MHRTEHQASYWARNSSVSLQFRTTKDVMPVPALNWGEISLERATAEKSKVAAIIVFS